MVIKSLLGKDKVSAEFVFDFKSPGWLSLLAYTSMKSK